MMRKCFVMILCGLVSAGPMRSQRTYVPHSVLSSGTWYKIGVKDPGVYKIDIPFLNKLGLNSSSIPSASIRLFGNGGQMLSESNADTPIDDLTENAIMVVDGGDGNLNGSDFVLFYASGPDKWIKDSVAKKFIHQKNIYSDTSFYFLNIGGAGKRVQDLQFNISPSATVNSFNERVYYENDLVNLLSSGKEWYGEEFADAPGKTLSRNFPVSLPGLQINQPVTIVSDCIARSIGNASRFDININNQPGQQVNIPATGAGIYDLFAKGIQQQSTLLPGQENLSVNFTFVPGAFNAQGWLNWFEIHGRRNLSLGTNNQLTFRDWNSVGNPSAEFIVSNAGSTTQVWETTDPLQPINLKGTLSGSQFIFRNDCSKLREYIVFNPSGAFTPIAFGAVPNQDLHNSQPADYIIITHQSLLGQANRLAEFHRQKNNLRVFVTTAEKIFNEFSSGSTDVSAIRDFVKMYYDKAANAADKPKYLLLFGDASFDYKNRVNENTSLLPAYENNVSLDPLETYTSDDFFGFLDDNENINSGLITNLLDIGIGRIPAKNAEEATNYADKVIAYYSKESLGPWRNQLTFVADDEDNNLHLNDAETLTATTTSINPVFNINKIYLDAYRQQSSSAGSRYPQVNEAINNRMFNGTLIWNYSGHGGAARLADETVVDLGSVEQWNNPSRLPLLVTATCDFAPYDNPFLKSLGENVLFRPRSGSIALMTTTRLVSSFSNRVMNNNYLQVALQPDGSGNYKTLGQAVMAAKNLTYQNSGDIINNRKFTLLGDPAVLLAFPQFKISTTKVNGIPTSQADTLSAGEKAIIEGEVTNNSGILLSGFNGTVYPVIYDKPETINTLANDPGSQVTSFQQQLNTIFKGKATVTNGRFSFEFKIPRDINYQYGNGRISYYAEDGSKDGSDYFNGFIVGGSSGVADNDKEGPGIKAWLNDEKFVNGSITNENPILVLKLSDSSGINTMGTSIGHDITVIVDNDNNNPLVLNNFYEADLDDYRQGTVRFQLPAFEPGHHTLRIKAWDILNNSSESILDFLVVNDDDLTIDHVLNYPNPFSTQTQFWFEHNKPGQDLFVQIHIYSLTGRIIKTLQKTINTSGNRSCELEWDAKDEFGDKVGRGVYFYKLSVKLPGLKTRSVLEKLVVL